MFGFGRFNFGWGGTAAATPRKNAAGDDVLYESVRNLLLERSRLWVPDLTAEIHAYLRTHPEFVWEIHPRRLEELVASIFKNQGFDVELTPESRDGGYDVLAVQKDSITGDRKHLIECKRNAPDNKVGIAVVQRMLGVVVQHSADRGIVVTTSFFTSPAKVVEQESKRLVSLANYDVLCGWLHSESLLSSD